jgi:hypothetical protein
MANEQSAMSTSPSSLSAGLQALYNDGLLPSNLTTAELQNASPAQLTQLSISNLEAEASAAMFGASESFSEDSVGLSPDVEAMLLGSVNSAAGTTSSVSTDPILEALATSQLNSSDAALAGVNSETASGVATGSTATLFNYLG